MYKGKIAFVQEENRLFRLKEGGKKIEVRNTEQVNMILHAAIPVPKYEALAKTRPKLSYEEKEKLEKQNWENTKEEKMRRAEEPFLCALGKRGRLQWCMSFFRSFISVSKDPIYRQIRHYELDLYQWYFNEIYYAHFIQGSIDSIINEAQHRHHLNPILLSVMVEQFMFADEMLRSFRAPEGWIRVVLARKEIDFFPSSQAVLEDMSIE